MKIFELFACRRLGTHLLGYTAILVSMFCFAAPASAWDVTFTRNNQGNRNSNSYNLFVVMQQQDGTGTQKNCYMNWNDGDNACTITGFPSTTNALVTVYHRTSPYGEQSSVIGKIAFWVSVFNHSVIHIPTGTVSYKTDKTWSQLVSTYGGINVAILPQANIEMGDTFSNRPNSGRGYFGQLMGNCGSKDLASDQSGLSVCEIDYLAGCYSPVFARPASGANKAKIFTNKTDNSGTASHVLCVGDGELVDYGIKVQ